MSKPRDVFDAAFGRFAAPDHPCPICVKNGYGHRADAECIPGHDRCEKHYVPLGQPVKGHPDAYLYERIREILVAQGKAW